MNDTPGPDAEERLRQLRTRWSRRTRAFGLRSQKKARLMWQKFQKTERPELERWGSELESDLRAAYRRYSPAVDRWAGTARSGVTSAVASVWLTTRRILTVLFLAILAVGVLAIINVIANLAADPSEPAGTAASRTADRVTSIRCTDCRVADVNRIIDGDTLDTSLGRIRIYGADTPEVGERCAAEATTVCATWQGRPLRVEQGPRAADRYGRNLFYLYTLGGEIVEAWRQDGQHRETGRRSF